MTGDCGGAPMTVRCLLRDQHDHVTPVERSLGALARFVYDEDWSSGDVARSRPDVVLCVNDYQAGIAACLDAAKACGIPSVVLQDGILEWRCQYENPLFGAGGGAPQHQPVLADKIACIGRQSARQIAAWGNGARVEITGMPRLDHLFERPPRPRRRPGSRLLVMTAKKPGFDAAQREVTLQSLRDVQAHVARLPGVSVTWRVSRQVAAALGVENQLREATTAELAAALEESDAVVTTPSTAMLEAMCLDRPVAALDYHNVPRFVATAWTISAPEHIGATVAELLDPPLRKLAFQRDLLADSLQSAAPAAPRVGALLLELSRYGPEGDRRGFAIPGRIIASRGGDPTLRPPPLAELYPGQPVFAERDIGWLQVRLARAEKENERLRRELGRHSVVHRLYALGRQTVERLRDGRF